MKVLKPWLAPLVATCAVVGLVVPVGHWQLHRAKPEVCGVLGSGRAAGGELCEGYPWRDPYSPYDRMMNIVVENDGAYIGEERVPYECFRLFMIRHARRWRPDYVSLSGPTDGRFGHGVEVFDTLRLLHLVTIWNGSASPSGTRLPAIELWRDGMPLEEWEQLEKEAAAPR